MNLRPVVLTTIVSVAAFAQAPTFEADANRGAELFTKLACIQCHSVNGAGGSLAPDLGRLADRDFTPASLAATMWNHAPTMWSAMRARGVVAGDMDEQAAADLFAYFYSVRFFEKPGDAARGKRVFENAGCAKCHGLTRPIRPDTPPVSEWPSLNQPFALSEAMWNHMRPMLAATTSTRILWPTLSAQDLDDLLVYLRNLPTSQAPAEDFTITSGKRGHELFVSKGCEPCHGSDTALAGRIHGQTMTDIAAEMWDHGPRMAAAQAPPAVFQPGEMSELLSYLWARQFFEDERDPARGRHVFVSKGCAGCHEGGKQGAPKLPVGGVRFSEPAMVAALWRHGPTMLGRMKAAGLAWPKLSADDMASLVAYLNSTPALSPEKKR